MSQQRRTQIPSKGLGPTRAQSRPRAFTLVETLIVMTIIAIVAGTLLPVITRPYVAEYRAQTIAEMQALESAIVGHPEIGDYGFLGTMGRLPKQDELSSEQPPLRAVADCVNGAAPQDITCNIPMGWAGPYVRSESICLISTPGENRTRSIRRRASVHRGDCGLRS